MVMFKVSIDLGFLSSTDGNEAKEKNRCVLLVVEAAHEKHF
jgi:hypothetical protein